MVCCGWWVGGVGCNGCVVVVVVVVVVLGTSTGRKQSKPTQAALARTHRENGVGHLLEHRGGHLADRLGNVQHAGLLPRDLWVDGGG